MYGDFQFFLLESVGGHFDSLTVYMTQ
eukprot:SAG11_NODE_30056_length_303_cov_1.887805_1_plen_26_part_10